MSRILVTGGSGFIGSALVKALVKAGDTRARARRQFARRPAPARRGRERHRVRRRRHPRRRRGRGRDARHRRGASPRLRQRHANSSTARPISCSMSACKGMVNVIDACRKQRHRHAGAGVELGGLSDAAARCRPTRRAPLVGARPAQSALLLRRRQDHQRADGDQLRPQVLRARADLSPAQCLWPGHGLRARHSAIRVAPEAPPPTQPSGHAAVRDPGHRAGDAQLLLRRRPGRRRHGHAREGRASRHLSRRHHGRGRRSPISRAGWRRSAGREIELGSRRALRRQHAAPLSRHFETGSARL